MKKVVVLTGAGISAESGLKTFRDNDGLWENHSVAEVATPEAFARNPNLVYRFYNERRAQLNSGEVTPNAAHIALAKLESKLADNLLIVTQNVDNLHEKAGSNNVLHMHGELNSVRCVTSQNVLSWTQDLTADDRCACCTPAEAMRPNIVWFGEVPLHMSAIERYLSEADVFVSIGTSGNVYPAAGFVDFANRCGAHTVELNLEPSEGSSLFAEVHHGPATQVVPEFVEQFL